MVRSRFALVFALALTLAGPTPAQTPEKAPGKAPEKTPRTGQERSDLRLVDHDFRFALSRPDENWSLLTKEEVARLVPDAEAGLSCHGGPLAGSYAVVIVERADGEDLEAPLELALATLGELATPAERTDARLGGLPARRARTSLVLNGQRVRYEITVARRGPWILRLNAWTGLSDALGREAGESARAAFSALEGEIRQRIVSRRVPDAAGPGWILRDHEFRSTTYDFAVSAPSAWYPLVGEELLGVNEDACVGLASHAGDRFLVVIAEPVFGKSAERVIESVRANNRELFGEAAEPKFEAICFGEKRRFDVAYSEAGGGTTVILAAFATPGRVYQILAWRQGRHAKEFGEEVATLSAGLRRLTDVERKEAERIQRESPDPDFGVGPDSRLRHGVFAHYPSGLRWKKPDRGTWVAAMGDAVAAISPGADLAFSELEHEVRGAVYIERLAPDVAIEAWHRGFVAVLRENIEGGTAGESAAVEVGGGEGWRGSVGWEEAGIAFTVGTVSFRCGTYGIHVTLSGLRENVAAAEGSIAAALAAFECRPGGLEAGTRTESVYADDRFGYAVRLQDGDLEVRNVTPPQLGANAVVVQFLKKGARAVELHVSVFAVGEADPTTNWLRSVAASFGTSMPGFGDAEVVTVPDARLDGRPAHHEVRVMPDREVHLLTQKRGARFVGLVEIRAKDGEALLKRFRFVE
ncbi:MAG: hypothetical protein R3F20_13245 [Planctomycetota bacterium]